ncbi:hypothetical protein ALC60_08004 [Trachymyrmex zeteki]|uniref:PRELI/MSF1 domain-containing protein n=1 Tax=Mycetomoellerius zeteki TaxID=64791 RepID=A0A151WYR4_9HYME|nr:hypothetical protein ALC60_08004 [Trachymyrmex zeteki]
MTLDTKCKQPAIGWTLYLIGYANLCYASERSEVDPVNKQMILRTHNALYNEKFLDHEVI